MDHWIHYSMTGPRTDSYQLNFTCLGACTNQEWASYEAREGIQAFFLFCFNLRKNGVIKPHMIHCVTKLLLGSQHHPAFISKQSLIDNKKHVKQTGPLLWLTPRAPHSTRPSRKKSTQLYFSQPEGKDFYVYINGSWDFFFFFSLWRVKLCTKTWFYVIKLIKEHH